MGEIGHAMCGDKAHAMRNKVNLDDAPTEVDDPVGAASMFEESRQAWTVGAFLEA
jgi:hypothetical protein